MSDECGWVWVFAEHNLRLRYVHNIIIVVAN